MSVVKIIELLAESPLSWEAATQVAVAEASKTIKHINQERVYQGYEGIR